MPLTIKEVEHLAKLAKLQLTTEEKEKYAKEISAILAYVEKINQAMQESGVTAAAKPSVRPEAVSLRADEVIGASKAEQEAMLAQAPAMENNLIKTKAVFE